VVNATSGAGALAALEQVGAENLAGKPLLDLTLPLDMSEGMPPKLLVANDDSLGEQIQRAFPTAKVVKTLTPVLADIMVDPTLLDGHHTVFVAGDDADAKGTITGLLHAFGWPQEDLVDLGGITEARAIEMYSRLFFSLVGVYGDFNFSIKVVRNA
jgi:predicted dinucleotide-binding enzyme